MFKLKDYRHKLMMRGIKQLIQTTRQSYRIYGNALKNCMIDEEQEKFYLQQMSDLSIALEVMEKMTGITRAGLYMKEHKDA